MLSLYLDPYFSTLFFQQTAFSKAVGTTVEARQQFFHELLISQMDQQSTFILFLHRRTMDNSVSAEGPKIWRLDVTNRLSISISASVFFSIS